jgi:hypothetical protein
MQLWEYLFNEDQRSDLADPARIGHVEGLVERLTGGTRPPQWLSVIHWTHNLLCLRVLSRRLKKKRLKPKLSFMDDLPSESDALKRLHYYVGMFRVIAEPKNRPCKLTILPGDKDGFPMESAGPYRDWEEALEVYWQVVFRSLLLGEVSVCERCGANITGKTPKGRPKRRTLCDKCTWKKWYEKQPAEKMRAKWRLDKKKHPN